MHADTFEAGLEVHVHGPVLVVSLRGGRLPSRVRIIDVRQLVAR